MYLDIVEDKVRISKIAMIGLGEEMVVSFQPSGTIKRDPISGMDFVWIPGRSFTMGCSSPNEECQDSEKSAHEVYINGFWIGRYEVTQAQWERIMGSDYSETHGNQSENNAGNYPAMTFSDEFLKRLNKKAKKEIYRLPSEAEWEYAARAGSSGVYSFGDEPRRLGEFAWYSRNSSGKVHPVGQLKPNKWGLYDMHGNVWELCQDFWHPNYENAPSDGRAWTGGDKAYRVVRGGGVEDPANFLRCASRSVSDYDSDRQFHRLGFRLVRSCGFYD
jgi:formylglycine-generating enzyme required for sulfatase activity